MTHPRTEAEIADAVEDQQVTLDLLVAHLGLESDVSAAITARRQKAERSRAEIERSLGNG